MILSSEEIGMIAFRLAIADELFLRIFIDATELAGERMLPEDAEKIKNWSPLVRAMRESFSASAAPEEG